MMATVRLFGEHRDIVRALVGELGNRDRLQGVPFASRVQPMLARHARGAGVRRWE